MTLTLALVAILVVAFAAGWLARSRAGGLRTGGRLNSLPFYHGAYAFLWAALPALVLIAAWTPIQTRLVDEAVLASPEGKALPGFRHAARLDPESKRAQIASGEIESRLQSGIRTRWLPLFKQAEALLCGDGRRRGAAGRLRRGGPGVPAGQDRLPSAHRRRAMGDGLAGRRVA